MFREKTFHRENDFMKTIIISRRTLSVVEGTDRVRMSKKLLVIKGRPERLTRLEKNFSEKLENPPSTAYYQFLHSN